MVSSIMPYFPPPSLHQPCPPCPTPGKLQSAEDGYRDVLALYHSAVVASLSAPAQNVAAHSDVSRGNASGVAGPAYDLSWVKHLPLKHPAALQVGRNCNLLYLCVSPWLGSSVFGCSANMTRTKAIVVISAQCMDIRAATVEERK